MNQSYTNGAQITKNRVNLFAMPKDYDIKVRFEGELFGKLDRKATDDHEGNMSAAVREIIRLYFSPKKKKGGIRGR